MCENFFVYLVEFYINMNFLNRKGKKLGFLCIVVSGFGILSACRDKGEKLEPVAIGRYDKALMEMDTSRIQEDLERMASAFPLYFEGADLRDTFNILRIKAFVRDPVVRQLYGRVEETYGQDLEALEQDLGALFGRMKKLFPGFRNPDVYTYVSYLDFENRVLYMDSVLSIAIDVYADGNQALFDEMGIPRYLSRRLNPDYLLPDVARSMALAWVPAREAHDLLDYIVQEGKIMYVVNRLLPDIPASVLLGYTDEQMAWCKEHEGDVWHYLVQQDLLFETNPFQFRYFVNEGPFNPLLPGAPARLAQFTGWRMVESYMKRNGKDQDALWRAGAREVLQVSAYKP